MIGWEWLRISPTILQSQCGVYTIVKKMNVASKCVTFDVYVDQDLTESFEGRTGGAEARQFCYDNYAEQRPAA